MKKCLAIDHQLLRILFLGEMEKGAGNKYPVEGEQSEKLIFKNTCLNGMVNKFKAAVPAQI